MTENTAFKKVEAQLISQENNVETSLKIVFFFLFFIIIKCVCLQNFSIVHRFKNYQ